MNILTKIKNIVKNKIIFYLLVRYFAYFLQFIISIIVAVKLGKHYFGIWSFILLLLSYFQVFDFGISNSINVLLVQNKGNTVIQKGFIKAAYLVQIILGAIVVGLALYYYCFGIGFFDKYEIGSYFYIVCLIAIFAYINKLLMTIFRVKNKLYQIAFFQSVIHILVFVLLFTISKQDLLTMLCIAYLLGQFLSFLLFSFTGNLPSLGKIEINKMKILLTKGWYLFLYNMSFYLLVISIRTIVSLFYTIEQFAVFSFSYNLANAILLLLEAMGFIIFPKLIDKLNTDDTLQIKNTIKSIRINYVTLAHGLIYLALLIFPIFLSFTPKYKEALPVLNIVALSIVLYTNVFGYNTFLLAKNREKNISIISVAILLLNIIIAYILASVLNINYVYIVIVLMLSYLLYSFSFVYMGSKIINGRVCLKRSIRETFPLHLFIPYVLALVIVVFNFQHLMFLPILIFIIFNFKYLKIIAINVKKIISNPSIINI